MGWKAEYVWPSLVNFPLLWLLLPFDEAIASSAVIVIVSGSVGRTGGYSFEITKQEASLGETRAA